MGASGVWRLARVAAGSATTGGGATGRLGDCETASLRACEPWSGGLRRTQLGSGGAWVFPTAGAGVCKRARLIAGIERRWGVRSAKAVWWCHAALTHYELAEACCSARRGQLRPKPKAAWAKRLLAVAMQVSSTRRCGEEVAGGRGPMVLVVAIVRVLGASVPGRRVTLSARARPDRRGQRGKALRWSAAGPGRCVVLGRLASMRWSVSRRIAAALLCFALCPQRVETRDLRLESVDERR